MSFAKRLRDLGIASPLESFHDEVTLYHVKIKFHLRSWLDLS